MFAVFAILAILSIQASADPCSQPIVSGMCMAYFPSFGYNSSESKCVPFVYGGCQGNDNRFSTMAECEAKCVKRG